jgi:hypothetical protein
MSASPATVCELVDDTRRLRVLADMDSERDQPEPWQAAATQVEIARRIKALQMARDAIDREIRQLTDELLPPGSIQALFDAQNEREADESGVPR